MEAPAGVGFSYSDNPEVDYNTDDNKTALDNYKFLVNWFSNYSEYSTHDFYVTYVHNTTNSGIFSKKQFIPVLHCYCTKTSTRRRSMFTDLLDSDITSCLVG